MFLDSRLQKPAKGSLGRSFLAVLVGKKGRENQDAKDVVVSLNVPSDPCNSYSFGSSHRTNSCSKDREDVIPAIR